MPCLSPLKILIPYISHSNSLFRFFAPPCKTLHMCSLLHIYICLLLTISFYRTFLIKHWLLKEYWPSWEGLCVKELCEMWTLEPRRTGHLITTSALLWGAGLLTSLSTVQILLTFWMSPWTLSLSEISTEEQAWPKILLPQNLKELLYEFNSWALSLHKFSEINSWFLKNKFFLHISGWEVLT